MFRRQLREGKCILNLNFSSSNLSQFDHPPIDECRDVGISIQSSLGVEASLEAVCGQFRISTPARSMHDWGGISDFRFSNIR